jgi:disulfide bond formation protein DsbB
MNTFLIQSWARVRQAPSLFATYAIFVIATIGLLGSLYFSNYGDPAANIFSRDLFPIGEGFPPCRLCWYARILLYPMIPISLIGILKKDRSVVDYLLPLSLLGVLLTAYHSFMQWFPAATENVPGNCDVLNPCNVAEVTYFGFVTIPFLGFIAFTVITALIIAAKRLEKKSV